MIEANITNTYLFAASVSSVVLIIIYWLFLKGGK